MASKRPYLVRQAILQALADVYPGGKDPDKLEHSGPLRDVRASREDLLEQATILQSGGYIDDLRGRGRDPWWKVTHKGLCQIRKEVVLNEVVWGEEAL